MARKKWPDEAPVFAATYWKLISECVGFYGEDLGVLSGTLCVRHLDGCSSCDGGNFGILDITDAIPLTPAARAMLAIAKAAAK